MFHAGIVLSEHYRYVRRRRYTDEEIVTELETALGELEDYREQFGVTDPREVSLLEAADADDVEESWKRLSKWKTS